MENPPALHVGGGGSDSQCRLCVQEPRAGAWGWSEKDRSSQAWRRRRLLSTTLRLLKAMAALAMMGERSQPVKG